MTGERDMYSTNSLIHSQSSYYDGRCVGVKNDYSDQGGYSLATVAKSGEMEYICVLFGAQTLADDRVGSYVDATAMLDWALENFQVTTILQKDDPCAEIPVELCKKTDKIVLLARAGVHPAHAGRIPAGVAGLYAQHPRKPDCARSPWATRWGRLPSL